jgi:hypothetical protein
MNLLIKPDNILKPTKKEDASIVIVYDIHGNPVIVIEELDDGALIIKSGDAPGFSEMLRMTGITTDKAPSVVKL